MEPSLDSDPVPAPGRPDVARLLRDAPSWTLTARQLGDLELILTGAYGALDRFMTRADADACDRELRDGHGARLPVPILLEVSENCARAAPRGAHLVLRDLEGVPLAVLSVEDAWNDAAHCIGGPLTPLQVPQHPDLAPLRLTPAAVRAEIVRRHWPAASALAAPRGSHGRALERALANAGQTDAGVVVLAVADPREDLAARVARVRELEAVCRSGPANRAFVWVVPLARRERLLEEALLTLVIARNAGCTQLAYLGPGAEDADAATLAAYGARIGCRVMAAADDGEPRPEVTAGFAARAAATQRTGFTVFFTGLSGSGKSTIANLVRLALIERTGRPVTLLDGDLVRQHLSSELGFSREHRDLNIRRIAFVASEITKHGGMAICAPIAPYDRIRREARAAIEPEGGFVLVYVDTPLQVCEARDRKGLYAKARAGLIAEFTGVSDPYEPPQDADVVVSTPDESAEDAAARIVRHLEERGYLRGA